jgi:hypothetical protein
VERRERARAGSLWLDSCGREARPAARREEIAAREIWIPVPVCKDQIVVDRNPSICVCLFSVERSIGSLDNSFGGDLRPSAPSRVTVFCILLLEKVALQ